MRIGIDVGGTNTDAVLLDDAPAGGVRVLAAVKSATTDDVTSGIVGALTGLQADHPFSPTTSTP